MMTKEREIFVCFCSHCLELRRQQTRLQELNESKKDVKLSK